MIDCHDGSDENITFCHSIQPVVFSSTERSEDDKVAYCKQSFICNITDEKGLPLECIPPYGVCDGHVDCSNGRDEAGCPGEPGEVAVVCSPGSLVCLLQKEEEEESAAERSQVNYVCIEASNWCDGVLDCHDGTDESDILCQHSRYRSSKGC
jgi:hypothetical protein